MNLELNHIDRRIWTEELDGFLPKRIFDVHTHLWSERHRGSLTGPAVGVRTEMDPGKIKSLAKQMFPGREYNTLMLGCPLRGIDVDGHNQWLAEQAAGLNPPDAIGVVVTPEMSPERLAELLKSGSFLCLKPYRLFAADPADCGVLDFFPEHLIEVTDHFGVAVTLHMSRRDGPADPRNLADLERLTKKYSHVKWILAHCARGFNSAFLEKSIHRLKDLPNTWFDTSAVADLHSQLLIVKHCDRSRVMFGSDNMVGGTHGKYISYALAWEEFHAKDQLEHCDATPTLMVYEQLRQQRWAADILGLTSGEIENIFLHNAVGLLNTVREGFMERT